MDTRGRGVLREAARCAAERLEQRALLSITVYDDEIWLISGTRRADTVIVEPLPGKPGHLRVIFNGKQAGTVKASKINEIEFMGDWGDDTFRAEYDEPHVHLFLMGEEGDDTLIGTSGTSWVEGNEGDDSLVGGAGDDSIVGQEGNDTLVGGPGDDWLQGREGDDHVIDHEGDDALSGGIGNDRVEGGEDIVEYFHEGALFVQADRDPENLDDEIIVLPDPKDAAKARIVLNGEMLGRIPMKKLEYVTIDAGDGDDVVRVDLGRAGRDVWVDVDGGHGNDRITGGIHEDELDGGHGDDTIDGGGGDDMIDGGEGDDRVAGIDDEEANENDNTWTWLSDGEWSVGIMGLSGYFAVELTIETAPGDSSRLRALFNGVVLDEVDAADVRLIDLSTGSGDDLIRIDLPPEMRIDTRVWGDDGDDTIFGSPGSDDVQSGNGDDVIDSGAGDDFLDGEGGADTVLGGAGDDVIRGQEGRDRIEGGEGNDELHGDFYRNDDPEGDADTLLGGAGDDTMYGGVGGDELSGGGGFDYVFGGAGNDTILGGGDEDLIVGDTGHDVIRPGPGDDTASGNGGDDDLGGGRGDDTLDGGRGDDSIDGGAGTDTVSGGAGDDSLPGICGADLILDDDGGDDPGSGGEAEALTRARQMRRGDVLDASSRKRLLS